MLTRLLDRLALLPDRTHANLIWCLRPALSRPRRQEPSLSSARSKGESVSLYRCLLLQASPQIPYRKPSAALPRTTAVRPSFSTAGTPTVFFCFCFCAHLNQYAFPGSHPVRTTLLQTLPPANRAPRPKAARTSLSLRDRPHGVLCSRH
jgi:hypothetical protein